MVMLAVLVFSFGQVAGPGDGLDGILKAKNSKCERNHCQLLPLMMMGEGT